MRIRCGFSIVYEYMRPVSMLLALSVHPSRRKDLLTQAELVFTPPLPAESYLDTFGNICHRIAAPQGLLKVSSKFEIEDGGLADTFSPDAKQVEIHSLPTDTLIYLLGSRYCETDKLSEIAWSLFGSTEPGWSRVQAICDFTNKRISFGYEYSRPDRTAYDAFKEGAGVCRDFAHLAIALCRCMNIPVRYCTGYLGDFGAPPAIYPMDFSAWFEVYLKGPDGGRWYPFDARHNIPRVGRILMARGRDAADVALSITFGATRLIAFEVTTDELTEANTLAEEPPSSP
jgi:transglutaminase-like putative cysteine protease